MTATKICPQCSATYATDQRFCAVDGAALRSQDPHAGLVGAVVAERYLVQRRLGEGGMGEVYLAEHVRMGRPCALKVMRPAMAADPDAVSRFNREAANASSIAHPNVAAIYDFGETPDGLIYLAMEYVEGEPLRPILERSRALPPARAARLVRQVADGLDAAHALGIVHRDLKPDNIMVGRDRDGLDLVKVVDFGIAKASGAEAQQVTRTGLVVGTPEFMSPEQLAGDPVDGRSDVYALGLVACTMLTGLHPFPSETIADTLVQRLTSPPRRLAELRPEVAWPTAVQVALDRALARRPAERFATAGDFARALEAALGSCGLLETGDASLSEARTVVMAAGGGAVLAEAATSVMPAPVAAAGPGAIPATVVDSARPSPAQPTPAARTSRRPMVLAAAVLLAAGASGATYLATRGGAEPPAANDSLAPGSASGALLVGGPASDSAVVPVATTSPSPSVPAGERAATPAARDEAPEPRTAREIEAGDVGPVMLDRASRAGSGDAASEARSRVVALERLLTRGDDVPTAAQRRQALEEVESLRPLVGGDGALDLRLRFLHAAFTGLGDVERGCAALGLLPQGRLQTALPADVAGFANLLHTNCEQPGGLH